MPHPVFLLQAAMRLRGKVLKKDENPSDRDYSGGGYYYQRSIAIYLREDHSFLYEERTFSSVRAGELSSSLESPTIRQEGTWKMEFRNESPHLVLRQPDDSVFREWAVKDGGYKYRIPRRRGLEQVSDSLGLRAANYVLLPEPFMDLTFAEAAGKTFLWLLILRISPLPTKYVFIGAMCNGAKYYRVSSNKINQNPIVELRNNQAQKLITFGMPNVARWTFDHGEDYGWFKSPACSCVSITLPASS